MKISLQDRLSSNSKSFKALPLSQKLALGLIALLILFIPIALYSSSQRNTTRSRAAENGASPVTPPGFANAVRFRNETGNAYFVEGEIKKRSALKAFTVETWLKISPLVEAREYGVATLISQASGAGPPKFKLTAMVNAQGEVKPKFSILNDLNAKTYSTIGDSNTALIAANTWSHVAVTGYVSGGVCRLTLFIDGILRETVNAANVNACQGYWTQYTHLQLANQSVDPRTYFFPGQLDEFRWSNARRYSIDFTPPGRQFGNDAKTVALYHFNDNLNDSSSNANHLSQLGSVMEYVKSTVYVANSHPIITRATLPRVRVNSPYKATIISYDINLGDKLTSTVNGLPPGLTANCTQALNKPGTVEQMTCAISGTPTQTGIYNVQVETIDSNNTSVKHTYKIFVLTQAPTAAPTKTPVPTSTPTTAPTSVPIATKAPSPTVLPTNAPIPSPTRTPTPIKPNISSISPSYVNWTGNTSTSLQIRGTGFLNNYGTGVQKTLVFQDSTGTKRYMDSVSTWDNTNINTGTFYTFTIPVKGPIVKIYVEFYKWVGGQRVIIDSSNLYNVTFNTGS